MYGFVGGFFNICWVWKYNFFLYNWGGGGIMILNKLECDFFYIKKYSMLFVNWVIIKLMYMYSIK